MATPTEPVTDARYQALSSPEPDPQVVHAAIEEIRYLSGHSVIAAIEAKIDSQSAGSMFRSPNSRPRLKLKPHGLTFSRG